MEAIKPTTKTKRPLYRELASLLQARANCIKMGNEEWQSNHTSTIESLVKNHMPSGSGIDSGTELDLETSNPEKLVFTFGYHHMNENGYYDGWTHHICIVRPSLAFGITIAITGPNRNEVKDYLYETFHHALTTEITIH